MERLTIPKENASISRRDLLIVGATSVMTATRSEASDTAATASPGGALLCTVQADLALAAIAARVVRRPVKVALTFPKATPCVRRVRRRG